MEWRKVGIGSREYDAEKKGLGYRRNLRVWEVDLIGKMEAPRPC
jgi:hypothetical protein